MGDPKRHLTLSQVAQILGLSWAQTWRLVLTNELSGYKAGGRWFVDAASVEAYRTRTGPSEVTTRSM